MPIGSTMCSSGIGARPAALRPSLTFETKKFAY